MRLTNLFFAIFALLPALSFAQHATGKMHDDWDKLLRKHVNTDGVVSYEKFKADKSAVDAYVSKMQASPPQSKWSREDKIAYWINLYNAFTIQTVLEKYPLASIMDIDGGQVWKTRKLKIDGKEYTLDAIEKEILIKDLKEVRVHFAVNCAAASCPPLLNAAYSAADLENQLDDRTRSFINNSKYNKISALSAEISQIFQWYAADFGDVKAFLAKYSITKLPKFGTLKYKTYDWKLNGK